MCKIKNQCDLKCEFKRVRSGKDEIGTCMLTLQQAIDFYKKYNVTTCEVGMGEQTIGTKQQNAYKIRTLKYKGGI